MNLNHIHIGTLNLKKSVEFYSTIFNFEKKFSHGEGVFLENKDGFLLAIDPVENIPQFPSWFHLGFCLDKESKVHELYKITQTKNIQIVREMMSEPNGFASFYISDPDGYKIEISWHNEDGY